MSQGTELARQIGSQIRSLRHGRGWTQRQLAERTGLAQQNLSAYERGEARPRLSTLARILAALDAEVRIVARQPPIVGTEEGSVLSPEALQAFIDRRIERALDQQRRRPGRTG